MRDLIKRIARWAAALTLIVVGLVLSIPGVPGPGLLIVLIGVFLLLPESRWLRKKYAALKQRYPKLFTRSSLAAFAPGTSDAVGGGAGPDDFADARDALSSAARADAGRPAAKTRRRDNGASSAASDHGPRRERSRGRHDRRGVQARRVGASGRDGRQYLDDRGLPGQQRRRCRRGTSQGRDDPGEGDDLSHHRVRAGPRVAQPPDGLDRLHRDHLGRD